MNETLVPSRAAGPRYVALAAEFTDGIESGALEPGERLSSVRSLAAQRGVSVTTVLAAMRLLEARGLIEARPQSGFFVRAREARLPEPAQKALPRAPRLPGVSELIMRVLEAGQNRDFAPIGSALPAPGLFPAQRIQRLVSAAARRHPLKLTTYAESSGVPELKAQIARRMRARGLAVDAGEIVVTNGCIEAVNLALRTVAEPGATVAIESPTYFCSLQIIESLRMKAIEIPTHPRDGVSIEALEMALRSHRIRACMFTPSVSNPLGSLMPDERRAALARLAREHDFVVIEDDVFGELAHAREPPRPLRHWDDGAHVILCSSFNKTLAPGLRVGWAIPGRHQARFEMLRHIASVATPEVLQYALADFLDGGGFDHHLRTLRRTFAQQVARMADLVADSFPAGTCITRPAGGFVLWVELPAGADALALWERAVQQGIYFVPGAIFTATDRYRNCLRLNCGFPVDARIEAAVRTLGALARESPGQGARDRTPFRERGL